MLDLLTRGCRLPRGCLPPHIAFLFGTTAPSSPQTRMHPMPQPPAPAALRSALMTMSISAAETQTQQSGFRKVLWR